MATHMMLERMAPLAPMRAPTMVSRLFESTKPSAVRAQPEALFSSVMTTGMSAPPTWPVTSRPSAPASPVPSSSTAEPWLETKAMRPRQTELASSALRLFWKRKQSGRPETRPWSFAKATRLPVTVSAPMAAARYVERLCTTLNSARPRKDARAVEVAATPTRLWKAATSCGRSVTSTERATAVPMPPPKAMVPSICASTGPSAPSEITVPQRPPVTPIRPRALPLGAVRCEESAAMERMQSKEEARYVAGARRWPPAAQSSSRAAPGMANREL
mmetsp:Transcript_79481/g.257435  ORF Transcript_79481/g.257435 Transcript_79481/m.257435 type:complete len:274 (-) Transcript_79481:1581-2402(-)